MHSNFASLTYILHAENKRTNMRLLKVKKFPSFSERIYEHYGLYAGMCEHLWNVFETHSIVVTSSQMAASNDDMQFLFILHGLQLTITLITHEITLNL